MKKFTGNFLLVGHRFGRVLRKIGLSMIVLLMTMTVFSQGLPEDPQQTLHVWAEKADDYCYRQDNIYGVDILVKDFVKIDSFSLVLKYPATGDFRFIGVTGVRTQLSAMVVNESPAGTIKFNWKGNPLTDGTILPDNDTIPIFTLEFELVNFPEQYVYNSSGEVINNLTKEIALNWDVANCKYWNHVGQVVNILTTQLFNGKLVATQKFEDVVVNAGVADCYGLDAVATVTKPAPNGYTYSFNGAQFTSSASTGVEAPSCCNTVVVKEGDCISFTKSFEVTAPEPLTFDVADTVYTNCPDGLADIQIFAEGGTSPYTYYVIPAADWENTVYNDLLNAVGKAGRIAAIEDYARTNSVAQRSEGEYWIIVLDANECIDVGIGIESGFWWQKVVVVDEKDSWDIIFDEELSKLMLDCYLPPSVTSGDGRIVFTITGGTPFVDGYNVWVNDMWAGRYTTYDSNVDEEPVLIAGEYNFRITDSLGCCCYDLSYIIEQPEPITFWVDHTDASCNVDNGSITVDIESIEGGSGDYEDWWWVYSTSPDFNPEDTDTIKVGDGGIGQSATGLAANVYYVRIFDANGCFADFRNPNGDNAVKVLTTQFDLVYDPIQCFGGSTDVSIVLTTGTGGHEFEYRARLGHWPWTAYQKSNVFPNLLSGLYTFEVYDLTIDCSYSWTVWIQQPMKLWLNVIDYLTLPPTCPENSDGNLVVQAFGGTPFEGEGSGLGYEYKLDNNAWTRATGYNTFAIDTKEHVIHVRDANGCEEEFYFRWDDMENEIAFADTIWNSCPLNKINLFNSDRWDDWFQGQWDWELFGNIQPDWGYLEDFSWYGIPIEHFTGVVTFDYHFWTSDSGWFEMPVQGVQQIRNPKFYITDKNPAGNPQAVVDEGQVIGHLSAFGKGDYWVVAMDEWGCFSNIEKIVIMDPPVMELTVSTEKAGCAGSTDGKIIIEAENGRFRIPPQNTNRYQYLLTQQTHIFTQEEWWAQATWMPFTTGNVFNDSLAVISVQASSKPYYIAVRDYCAVENPDLIQILGPFYIEGSDPIEVAWEDGMIKNITCHILRPEEDGMCVSDNDGAITGLLAATTGGSSNNYQFTLDYFYGHTNEPFNFKALNNGSSFPETNSTGEFINLPAGDYLLTITDDSLGCQTTYEIEITEPDCFWAEVDVVNPSCYEAHDGLLLYRIYGGTAPYQEATNNVGIWENANDIPEERWFDAAAINVEGHDFVAFDRRVRAGDKAIWVRDANGCVFGPVDVIVDQPGKLEITNVIETPVSCNNQKELHEGDIDDGSITFTPLGGWDMGDDGFKYTAELWNGATRVDTKTFDVLQDITFSGLKVGNYVIKLYEYNQSIADDGYAKPITTYSDYFDDFHNWIEFDSFQNPDLTKCFVLYDQTVTEPAPIVYESIDWRPVKCHNEATGEIFISNISGGTPSIVDGYYVGLEGPVDYDYTLQSNHDTHYVGDQDGIDWFKTGAGVNDFTFDNLTWGHYTVHVGDGNDCWIYKESGEIENPDTLKIDIVQLVKHAICNGGTGIIQIDASGGVGDYWYAVDSTLVPDPGAHTFPNDLDLNEYLANLKWQRSDTFDVTAATWIGYVKDENGCITGFATDKNGAPIYHHRTTVLEPDPILADGFDQVPAKCYMDANGKILIRSIWGGNGQAWTIEVSGTDYKGDPVSESYTKTGSSAVELTGLPASTNLTNEEDMTADDYYTIVIYDKYGCASKEFYQYVTQPEEFIVVMKDKQNAFICPNDQAGIFEVQVVKGGVDFGIGPDGKPLYEYKWEAYSDEGYTMLIDSLSDDTYGFTKTFLGYAGLYYRVWAQDANGCETSRDTFIQAPEPIEFSVRKLTCYGDPKASARIYATGTEGRTFRVLYKEILNGNGNGEWIEFNGWFTESIDMIEEFLYDDEQLRDRHYAVVVEDIMGCRSAVDTLTFDKVQTQLIASASINGNEITVEAFGGAVDEYLNHHYQYAAAPVGDGSPLVWQDDNIIVVDANAEYVVYVRDYHLRCIATDTVTGGAGTYTIAEIQGEGDASPLVGDVVIVGGTVTAIADGEGFFMQDAIAAWSGIFVATDETGDVVIGDGVKVIGQVAEIDDVTTIVASEVTVAEPLLAITPLELDSPSEVANEMYESVLTIVKKAGAGEVDEDTGQFELFYELDDNAVVNNWLYAYDTDSIIAGNFYNVTGIVNGRENAFTLEPRMEEDIEDITKTTPAVTIPQSVEFKVYPNPFNDYIYIDNHDKLTRVVISNIAGQRVIDIEFPTREIRTENLVSGVYVVSMFTEDGRAKTERIIKSKR